MTNVTPTSSEASGSCAPAPGNASNTKEVRLCVEGFKTLVNNVVEGRVPSADFLQKLKDLGATTREAGDYFNLLKQCLDQQRRELESVDPKNVDTPAPDHHEKTPEGLTNSEVKGYRV